MKHSIHFDPSIDKLSAIVAAVSALFGGIVVAGNSISDDDNPATGAGNSVSTESLGVDADGFPHDARIHSTSKAKTDKGFWRKLKGVSDEALASVTAELRAKYPAPTVTTPTLNTPPVLQQLSLPTLNTPPVLTPFESLIKFLADNTQSAANPNGRLTEDYIAQCCVMYGIKDEQGAGKLMLLQHATPDRIAVFRAGIAQALGLPAGS